LTKTKSQYGTPFPQPLAGSSRSKAKKAKIGLFELIFIFDVIFNLNQKEENVQISTEKA